MPNLITDQNQIKNATTADLLFTYNQLMGKSITRFSSRGAGESQVSNAILSAEYRAGRKGVQKGQKAIAQPLHVEQQEASPATEPSPQPTEQEPTMATRSRKAATPKRPPHKPKAAKRAPHNSIKSAIVEATGNGKTKLQEKSERAQCFEIVKRHGGGISVEKLQEKMGREVRGFIHKLIEGGHVRVKNA